MFKYQNIILGLIVIYLLNLHQVVQAKQFYCPNCLECASDNVCRVCRPHLARKLNQETGVCECMKNTKENNLLLCESTSKIPEYFVMIMCTSLISYYIYKVAFFHKQNPYDFCDTLIFTHHPIPGYDSSQYYQQQQLQFQSRLTAMDRQHPQLNIDKSLSHSITEGNQNLTNNQLIENTVNEQQMKEEKNKITILNEIEQTNELGSTIQLINQRQQNIKENENQDLINSSLYNFNNLDLNRDRQKSTNLMLQSQSNYSFENKTDGNIRNQDDIDIENDDDYDEDEENLQNCKNNNDQDSSGSGFSDDKNMKKSNIGDDISQEGNNNSSNNKNKKTNVQFNNNFVNDNIDSSDSEDWNDSKEKQNKNQTIININTQNNPPKNHEKKQNKSDDFSDDNNNSSSSDDWGSGDDNKKKNYDNKQSIQKNQNQQRIQQNNFV